jgi:hypothetical protein
MADPIATAARAAAQRLAAAAGPGLIVEVEKALAERRSAKKTFFDPVTLGSLIVEVATLAYAVFSDYRKHSSPPSREEVERKVREELPPVDAPADRVIEETVIEVMRVTRTYRKPGSGADSPPDWS